MRPVKLQSRALTPSLEPGVSQLGIPGHFKHNLNLLVEIYFAFVFVLLFSSHSPCQAPFFAVQQIWNLAALGPFVLLSYHFMSI